MGVRQRTHLDAVTRACLQVFTGCVQPAPVAGIDKAALVADVKAALFASKVCSYAQGMGIIKAKSNEKNWNVDMGGLARIWKVRLDLN